MVAGDKMLGIFKEKILRALAFVEERAVQYVLWNWVCWQSKPYFMQFSGDEGEAMSSFAILWESRELPQGLINVREGGTKPIDIFLIQHKEGGWGPFRRAAEWNTIFANLWAIWLHRNEVVFRGRSPSVDAIQHDARGIAYSWNRGGSSLSNFVPL